MLAVGEVEKKVTEGISFRLRTELITELRREAEQRRISLNTFANQILREYMDWHFSAVKAGWIPIQRDMLRKLMGHISEIEIKELADNTAKRQMKDLVLLIKREFNFRSFFDVIEAWLKVSQFPYNQGIKDYKYVLVIQHDMGIKWSNYMKQFFSAACEELASQAEIAATDNTISMKVDLRRGGAGSTSL